MEKQEKKKMDRQKIVFVLIGLAFLAFMATQNISNPTTSSTGQSAKIKLNNDTPEGAAMMFIKACIDDDAKAMAQINRSDSFNHPTQHVLDIAAKRQMATFTLSDFSFSVVERSGYKDTTRFIRVDGPAAWDLKMVNMNGKWYFDRLGSF